MKSAIYVVNANDNTVSVNGNIPLGTAVHGFGNNIKLNGNSIDLDSGYYTVSSTFDISATAAATVEINLYQDGTLLSSAFYDAQAIGDVATVSLPAVLVRVSKCCGASLTWTVTGSATSITNSSVEVLSV